MKQCPKCLVEHSKNGIFCSRSCANSRVFTEESNKKRSTSLLGKSSKKKNKPGQKHSEETRIKISNGVLASSIYASNKKEKGCVGKNHTDETKQKLSIIAKDRGLGGITSKTKLFFTKKNGEVVYLQSSYEVKFAEILEQLNIQWSRPDPFLWIDEDGKQHRYYPDFKVGDVFIDTKNDYLAKVDLPKINAVKIQNSIDLRIATLDMINEEFIASLV